MKLKHSISLLLVFVLLFSLVIPAYAAEGETTEVKETFPENETLTLVSPEIGVSLEDHGMWDVGAREQSVMGVKVTWYNPELVIHKNMNVGATWNPLTLKWELDEEPMSTSYQTFSDSMDICKITNLSLYEISVKAVFNPAEGLEEALSEAKLLSSYTAGSFAEGVTLDKAVAADYEVNSVAGTEGGSTVVTLFTSSIYRLGEIIENGEHDNIGTVKLTFSKAST